ncbi:hypothetical protein CCR85_02330 [Rhodothalassium salexigens]|uniref:YbjQ family protein n=1 Tax=Rhodothalassium salexigens TaxID=1086 RepID=UPI0019122A35|nr:YbjQ family protein [Rhodothalassium salexigens]MBK5910326.1 hypothetical protein [Rhodothalassium salexigens]MBK5921061.1 hypothetical protein [Rhodothalassium salexigens]
MAHPQDIRLTTAPTLAGATIHREIDIVSAEAVYGVNLFRDLFAQVRDVFGGRSSSMQSALKEAREEVMRELREEAAARDADGVVAVTLDYEELSGGGANMLLVVATGTAVRLK